MNDKNKKTGDAQERKAVKVVRQDSSTNRVNESTKHKIFTANDAQDTGGFGAGKAESKKKD